MSDIVIQAEGLGKCYRIGHQREPYVALRDVIATRAKSFVRRALHPFAKRAADPCVEEFWALRDVSFSVREGEVLGVIGRNGAGKSTLLKLLSRITDPAAGRVVLDGRVASLLEVGTGFHPELTGRENIFLNGAVLGMHRTEILSKFDDIVAFAEVEQFLDTPVKRYSSGMYLRLAFAVAAHLESEILLVDEVLAVGDAVFQRKCMGKMGEVAREGRTVLFVSHNMGVVSKLCTRGLVLDRGRVAFEGDKDSAIDFYTRSNALTSSTEPLATRKDRKGNGKVLLTHLAFYSEEIGQEVQALTCADPVEIRLRFRSELPGFTGRFVVGFYDAMDICPVFLDTHVDPALSGRFPGEGELRTRLSRDVALVPGDYSIHVAVFVNGEMADYIIHAAMLRVEEGDFFGSGKFPGGRSQCYARHHWTLHPAGQP